MPGVGAVEGFIAEREVSDDVALDRGLEQRPLEPGWVAQMAPLHVPVLADSHPGKHVAAEALGYRHSFARSRGRLVALLFSPDRSSRQARKDLFDHPDRLLYLL